MQAFYTVGDAEQAPRRPRLPDTALRVTPLRPSAQEDGSSAVPAANFGNGMAFPSPASSDGTELDGTLTKGHGAVGLRSSLTALSSTSRRTATLRGEMPDTLQGCRTRHKR